MHPPAKENPTRRLTVLAPLAGLAALGALTAAPAGAAAPATNGQITFARQIPGGGANVFITNPDGSNVHQVPLGYPAEDFGIPIWSPDRSQLLISHLLRSDASGNLLPFRPATGLCPGRARSDSNPQPSDP